jgi:adenosine deaminase
MVGLGLNVSINSDDPAYFGGYVGQNYEGVAESLGLDEITLTKLAANSIQSSFIADDAKTALISELG